MRVRARDRSASCWRSVSRIERISAALARGRPGRRRDRVRTALHRPCSDRTISTRISLTEAAVSGSQGLVWLEHTLGDPVLVVTGREFGDGRDGNLSLDPRCDASGRVTVNRAPPCGESPTTIEPNVDRQLPPARCHLAHGTAPAVRSWRFGLRRCAVLPQPKVLSMDAEAFLGTRLHAVTVWHLAVRQLPRDCSGGADTTVYFELARPARIDRPCPHMMITRPVDLGLEQLQVDPHGGESRTRSRTPGVPE